MLRFSERVKETTTTTGTGTLSLGGAASQCQSFVAGIGNGNKCNYMLLSSNGTDWEEGVGTVTSGSPSTLSRDYVVRSSGGWSKITLPSGTHTIMCVMPARSAVGVNYPSMHFHRGEMANLAAARARGASTPPRIVVQGHSHVVGEGAGTSTLGMTGARQNGWVVKMAQALGWQTGSFFGDASTAGAASVSYPTYDPRVSLGSFVVDSNATFGGKFFSCSGASSTDFTFTPESAFDTLTFWYPKTTTAATSVTVKVDGSSVGTVNQYSASNSMASSTFTTTLGTHTIAIQNAGSGICYITGIETRDSSSSAPILLAGGKCGASTTDLEVATSPWSWANVANTSLTPDVVILCCLINDINAGTTVATLSSRFDNLNNLARAANADVVNLVELPWSQTKVIDGTLDNAASLLRANAVSLGGAFADGRAVAGSSYAMAGNRSMTYDANHPNAAGHAAYGAMVAELFAY